MNLVIDEFDSNNGFSAYNNATIYVENELPEYIAGSDNTKSCLFGFEGNGDYIEKIVNIDVSNYDYVVLHFYSVFQKLTNGMYTIELDDNHIFDIQLFEFLTDIMIDLSEIDVITKIKITYKGSIPDRLIVSHCLAVKDEIPLDIFKSVKSLLEKEIFEVLGEGYNLGTVNTLAGDEKISIAQNTYLDRYAVVKIEDSNNTETHCIDENNESYYTFSKMYDGEYIKNNFVDAFVYLTVPVRYGLKQSEYNTPSINITGYNPNPILRGGKVENVINTFEDGTAYYRQDGQIQEHYIQITCIDRIESEVLTEISQIVRNCIAREVLWINGQKYDIFFEGRPEFIDLTDFENPVTGLVYTIKLEIKEQIWKSKKRPKTLSQNTIIEIQQ